MWALHLPWLQGIWLCMLCSLDMDLAGVCHTSCSSLRSIMHVCIYACMHICMYVCMCMLCVLDTCELISKDSADYGLADYGLHGFENLSRTKHFFLREHSAQCIYMYSKGLEAVSIRIRCVCRPTGTKPSSSQA